ncbi:hypothetical protein ACGFNU_17760 [Spirillospora sp. NPDC048911]|uniref:hypothetical protein n=1 Tax=Spirillospora sp. NPDC048911 TaxID=3364527 RepID=UPI0037125F54
MSCLRSERLLDAIEAHFKEASLESAILLEGEPVRGRSAEPVRLGTARTLMLDGASEPAFRDAVWTALVMRAQSHEGQWQLAALWMMLPGFRGIVSKLSRGLIADAKEIEAETVAGFLEALHKADATRPRLGSHLWWAAYRHGCKARTHMLQEIPSDELTLFTARRAHQDHETHPLAGAVHEGVLSTGEADLINRTRLEGERLGAVAERMGLRYQACHRRRARAEGRLAGYLLIDNDAALAPPSPRVTGTERHRAVQMRRSSRTDGAA